MKTRKKNLLTLRQPSIFGQREKKSQVLEMEFQVVMRVVGGEAGGAKEPEVAEGEQGRAKEVVEPEEEGGQRRKRR